MKARILSLTRDNFLRHNAVFFIGSMAVAILNYLYHPVMSRMMSVEDFGEVQALFSLLSQVGIPMSIFSMVAINLYANGHTDESPTVRQCSLLLAYVGGATVLALLVATPLIMQGLKLSTPLGITLIAGTLIISTLTIFGRAHLQASRQFVRTSLASILGAGGKLVGAAILVYFGFRVLGALTGFLFASLLAFFYVRAYAGAFMAIPRPALLRNTPELRHELRFGMSILFGTGIITFFSTADITFAKYLFSAEIAGLYSGISIIARIIFFATGSIAGVLLAHIKLSETPAHNRRVLIKGLLLTALIGGSGLLIMMLAPTLVIGLMVGETYLPYAHLLPALALHTFVLALLGMFTSYALALRRSSLILMSGIGVVSTFGFLYIGHSEPRDIVNGFLFGSIVTLIACAFTYLRIPNSRNNVRSSP